MKQVARIFGFMMLAVFVYFAQASLVQSAENPPAAAAPAAAPVPAPAAAPAPAFKAETGKVLFYSEPHDEGKVAVGDKKIDFDSLAFPDKNAIVAKGDTVTLETDGTKVKKGSLKKQ